MSIGNGARTNALASFLLVGACMAGDGSASQAEFGTDNPTDSSSYGGGGGGDTGGATLDTHFQVTRLTADQPGVAAFTEPRLQDVWGGTSIDEAAGATTPGGTFMNVAQTTGLLIEVEPSGRPTGTRIMLDKAITGIENNESDRIQMRVRGKCGRATLLVASQSGKLWGANPDVSATDGDVLLDRSNTQAQFTGVTLIPELRIKGGRDDGRSGDDHGGGGGDDGCSGDGHGGGGGGHDGGGHDGKRGARQTVLLVDFHDGRVLAYSQRFHPIALGNRFQIPDLPEGFAPFGIAAFEDQEMVVVTAAQRRAPGTDEPQIDQQVAGDGRGIVAAFDLTGNLMWSTSSNEFNIPWGLEMGLRMCATGALLVSQHGLDTQLDGPGNQFGGTILALDPRTGRVIGPLMATDTQPVRVQGIWGLHFGENIQNLDPDLLHLGAGLDNHLHGLFARLDPVPE